MFVKRSTERCYRDSSSVLSRREATDGTGRYVSDTTSWGRRILGLRSSSLRRPLICPPERLGFVAIPVHRAYGFELPTIPVIAESEACAEKLARYRRTRLARDVYDLAQFAARHVDEARLRRLWVLKVWADVVDDARGRSH
jgi:predicted nucleotidyltransferase component of viral defense system